MQRALLLIAVSACTSMPRVPTSSAASENASAAPLPHVAVALAEDAPPLGDAGAPMDMSMHHHHGGDHAP